MLSQAYQFIELKAFYRSIDMQNLEGVAPLPKPFRISGCCSNNLADIDFLTLVFGTTASWVITDLLPIFSARLFLSFPSISSAHSSDYDSSPLLSEHLSFCRVQVELLAGARGWATNSCKCRPIAWLTLFLCCPFHLQPFFHH